jgi:hypothetical protein
MLQIWTSWRGCSAGFFFKVFKKVVYDKASPSTLQTAAINSGVCWSVQDVIATWPRFVLEVVKFEL